ncbi:MAG: DUF2092 domain-containing protein [Chromatiales bacterium]|nr:DUF2092 domain-containing protein [Chromatiales bacterium]
MYDEVPADAPAHAAHERAPRRDAPARPARRATPRATRCNRAFWYDGQTFSALDREQNVWASGAVPPTVDARARLGVRPDRHGDPARRLPLCRRATTG